MVLRLHHALNHFGHLQHIRRRAAVVRERGRGGAPFRFLLQPNLSSWQRFSVVVATRQWLRDLTRVQTRPPERQSAGTNSTPGEREASGRRLPNVGAPAPAPAPAAVNWVVAAGAARAPMGERQ